jgi:hypothetical protein
MQYLRGIKVWMVGMTTLFGVASIMLSPDPARSAPTTQLPLSLCAPTTNTFTTDVTNPFFPLPVGQQWVLVGKEGNQNIGLQITVLSGTEGFYTKGNDGVPTISTVRVEETEWEDTNGDGVIDDDEFVIETSINFFAQTGGGTVCYFGEDVDIFLPEGGVSHEGAWRADDPGHAPGIFMPANPQVGMSFQQEVAPDIAEDEATIVAAGKTVRTPAQTFTDTLRVRDFNPLDGSRGTKSYARDVGLIQDATLLLLSY